MVFLFIIDVSFNLIDKKYYLELIGNGMVSFFDGRLVQSLLDIDKTVVVVRLLDGLIDLIQNLTRTFQAFAHRRQLATGLRVLGQRLQEQWILRQTLHGRWYYILQLQPPANRIAFRFGQVSAPNGKNKKQKQRITFKLITTKDIQQVT